MSGPIKPEDISEEAFYAHDGDMLHDFGLGKADLAKILNAAIDAGLVSPPCWAVVRPGTSIAWGPMSLEQAKRTVMSGEVIEHWKGQAE